MADHHREKTCEAVNDFIETQKVNIVLKDGAMKIEDLFIIDHLKRKASNEKKRIENENKELALCSFRPDISSSKTTLENLKKKKKIVLTAASNRETIKAQDQKMEENLAFKKCSVDRCKPLKDKSNLKMVASTKQIKDI